MRKGPCAYAEKVACICARCKHAFDRVECCTKRSNLLCKDYPEQEPTAEEKSDGMSFDCPDFTPREKEPPLHPNCRCSLEIEPEITKEENTMLPGFQTASIQFIDGYNKEKIYFYALYDETIQPGDTVVVSTGHHGLALATVAYIGGPASYVTNNREIVCKVDMAAFEVRKEKAKKLQELKADMDERVKAYQAVALYEMAAEKDPALKALLEQFKALQEEPNNAAN